MNYCSNCGKSLSFGTPPDDDRPRFLCDSCGTIHYQNPVMVVGCIPEVKDKILLCRRAIEPCSGKWTLPAGYLENGETVSAGAVRETYEEACANDGRVSFSYRRRFAKNVGRSPKLLTFKCAFFYDLYKIYL